MQNSDNKRRDIPPFFIRLASTLRRQPGADL